MTAPAATAPNAAGKRFTLIEPAARTWLSYWMVRSSVLLGEVDGTGQPGTVWGACGHPIPAELETSGPYGPVTAQCEPCQSLPAWNADDEPNGFDSGYLARDDSDTGNVTTHLVHVAQRAGVLSDTLRIAGDPYPALQLMFVPADAEGGPGFQWQVSLPGVPDCQLSSLFEGWHNLEYTQAPAGVESALMVLRIAEDAGNRLYEQMLAYAAAPPRTNLPRE